MSVRIVWEHRPLSGPLFCGVRAALGRIRLSVAKAGLPVKHPKADIWGSAGNVAVVPRAASRSAKNRRHLILANERPSPRKL